MHVEDIVKYVVIALVIIGAINWGLVGAFHFDVVKALFHESVVTRVIYVVIGLAGLCKLFWVVFKKK